MVSVEVIIWYLFVIDAVFANLTVLFWKKWFNKTKVGKWIPIHGGWTLIYLGLVLWVGYALYRLGMF